MKNDPRLLEAMKDELRGMLGDALEKRGISRVRYLILSSMLMIHSLPKIAVLYGHMTTFTSFLGTVYKVQCLKKKEIVDHFSQTPPLPPKRKLEKH